MAIFLLQRLAAFAVTLLVASLVIFLVMEVLPGDPAALMLGVNARPDTLAALRAEMGLDQPAAARYLAWLGGLAIGDFGTSYTYGVSVWELVRSEEHTSELQSLMRISYAVLCLKKNNNTI